jgi:hypothetical protein
MARGKSYGRHYVRTVCKYNHIRIMGHSEFGVQARRTILRLVHEIEIEKPKAFF